MNNGERNVTGGTEQQNQFPLLDRIVSIFNRKHLIALLQNPDNILKLSARHDASAYALATEILVSVGLEDTIQPLFTATHNLLISHAKPIDGPGRYEKDVIANKLARMYVLRHDISQARELVYSIANRDNLSSEDMIHLLCQDGATKEELNFADEIAQQSGELVVEVKLRRAKDQTNLGAKYNDTLDGIRFAIERCEEPFPKEPLSTQEEILLATNLQSMSSENISTQQVDALLTRFEKLYSKEALLYERTSIGLSAACVDLFNYILKNYTPHFGCDPLCVPIEILQCLQSMIDIDSLSLGFLQITNPNWLPLVQYVKTPGALKKREYINALDSLFWNLELSNNYESPLELFCRSEYTLVDIFTHPVLEQEILSDKELEEMGTDEVERYLVEARRVYDEVVEQHTPGD